MLKTRARQLARAFVMRCPLCGTPWPRTSWLVLQAQCPTCQVRLERNESDFFLGSYTLNLLATLLVAVAIALANVRWQQVNAPLRIALSGAAIIGFALVFYPMSKLLWLFADAQFRPPVEKDFGDGEDA